jgi:DNA excision repair protein ERCC-2
VLPEDIFPYPSFRHGQKELAQSVYLACKKGERFVAEAMSGFGKTAAVLAGSISAAAEDDLQIIYVCRTKRQVIRVLEELNRFSGRLPVRATSLFSKYDYCLLRQKGSGVSPETFKWYCSFQTSNNLCSYLNVAFNHDKIEKLVEAQTSGPGPISELLKKGTELHVCPYEVGRLSLARSRIIVTTYHYLLDLNSRSILVAEDKSLDKVVAVIDEAHNIREFMSGNSTTTLSFSDIRDCINDSRSLFLPRICSAISEIGGRATQFCSKSDHWLVRKESFVNAITGSHTKDWLSDRVFELSTNAGVAWYSVATNRNLPTSIIKLGSFLSSLLSSLDSDEIALVKSDSTLFLTDARPSRRFLGATAGFRSLILLSATINPSDLFLRSIGLDEASTTVHSAITGYKFRIRTVIDTGVTTRFKMRTAEMYFNITDRVAAVCSSVPGGIGVFLPSYAVLESIRNPLRSLLERTTAMQPRRTLLIERPGLTNEDSEEMMRTFKSSRGCVLLAVQGGRFSEGEDFPGDEMDVSIVVGLALPPPSPTMFAEYGQMESGSVRQAPSVHGALPAPCLEEGVSVRRAARPRTREGGDGPLHGLAIRGAENNRLDAVVVERRSSQGGVRARVDLLAHPRLLLERTGSLNWTPLRNAILAAARWSLVAPTAPRLPADVPDSSTISMEADGGSLSRNNRANLREAFGSPAPTLTESDE